MKPRLPIPQFEQFGLEFSSWTGASEPAILSPSSTIPFSSTEKFFKGFDTKDDDSLEGPMPAAWACNPAPVGFLPSVASRTPIFFGCKPGSWKIMIGCFSELTVATLVSLAAASLSESDDGAFPSCDGSPRRFGPSGL
eukprot:CAMPEP_0185276176 /NCGR_PEP_ID=MMETSP1359-20130426/55614_1 /TAXON_ID=552665 /ORGANISM="Bigelowiella longifila, Strain CCMP242" /LENGTH=137 /DNA_ID=CAMNT_0027869761 /DNA_START=148 /DNA_END=559 /DNA_ORIENTATION=+